MASDREATLDRSRAIAPSAARARFIAAALLLCAALLFGGASAAGWIANAVLTWLALAVLAWLVVTERGAIVPADRAVRWFFAGYLAIVLVYLVPLPPRIWTSLPGRAEPRAAFAAARMALPWQPLALIPDDAVASALAMVTPFTIFVLVCRLPRLWRERLGMLIVAGAMLGLVLGAMQLIGGTASSLRFYRITTPGRAVGQFANPNHLASLLAVAIPLLAIPIGDGARSTKFVGSNLLIVVMVAALVAGIVVAGSSAGYGLAVVSIVGSALVVRRGRMRPTYLMAVTAAVAGVAVLFAAHMIYSDTPDPGVTSRLQATTRSIEIARQLFPFGGGLGSFVELYRTASDPMVSGNTYLNHVHDDFVEAMVELGIFGVALIGLFVGWFVRRASAIWLTEPGANTRVARAATIVIALLLIHSLVDYPLRTAALASVMAWACACLLDPPGLLQSADALRARSDRDLIWLAGLGST